MKKLLFTALCLGVGPVSHAQFVSELTLTGEIEMACNIDFDQRVGLFARATVSPERNDNNLSISLGANLHGVLSRHRCDAAGVAIARSGLLRSPGRYDTALELVYVYNFTERISLEPEVQYIVPPPATAIALPDALVGLVRLQVSF